jgi:hypothetical protein
MASPMGRLPGGRNVVYAASRKWFPMRAEEHPLVYVRLDSGTVKVTLAVIAAKNSHE